MAEPAMTNGQHRPAPPILERKTADGRSFLPARPARLGSAHKMIVSTGSVVHEIRPAKDASSSAIIPVDRLNRLGIGICMRDNNCRPARHQERVFRMAEPVMLHDRGTEKHQDSSGSVVEMDESNYQPVGTGRYKLVDWPSRSARDGTSSSTGQAGRTATRVDWLRLVAC